jgi:exopolyphosphatase/guanosine-5'-triphosphate,3'-diphosphate pyrophosphatase
VASRLAERLDVDVAPSSTVLSHGGRDHRLPVGPATLLADVLAGHDPPLPEQLTNAIGLVMDHVDDVIREQPAVVEAHDVHVSGDEAWHFTTVEHGRSPDGTTAALRRDAVEEVFRTLATETRTERLGNPGLDPRRVDSVLGTSCVIVGLMRRLQLPGVTFEAPR